MILKSYYYEFTDITQVFKHIDRRIFITALFRKVKVEVTQSCLTLCDPMDYTVPGILQTEVPEWVAFPFSRGSSHPRDQIQVSRIAGGFFTS